MFVRKPIGVDMSDFEKSLDAIESLTPREKEVLRKRFGTPEEAKEPAQKKPPNNDDNGGSGGVPAPADPPS